VGVRTGRPPGVRDERRGCDVMRGNYYAKYIHESIKTRLLVTSEGGVVKGFKSTSLTRCWTLCLSISIQISWDASVS